LAFDPSWNAYARSVAPEFAGSVAALAVIATAAHATRGRRLASLALCVIGGETWHASVWWMLPALCWNDWKRTVRPLRRRAPPWQVLIYAVGGATLLTGAYALVAAAGWPAADAHGASIGSWLENLWQMEARTPVLETFTVSLALASLAGVLRLCVHTRMDEHSLTLHRLTGVTLWAGCGALAVTGCQVMAPYLLIVPCAVLEVALLVRLCHDMEFLRARRLLRLGWVVAVAAWWLAQWWRCAGTGGAEAHTALALLAAVLAGGILLAMSWLIPRGRWQPWLAAVQAIIVLAWLPVWTHALGQAQFDLARARRHLEAMLPPDARLGGSMAAALHGRSDAALVGPRELRAFAGPPGGAAAAAFVSHWLLSPVEAVLATEQPGRFEFVEEMHVCGRAVRLFRSVPALGPANSYEQGVAALREQDYERAEACFRLVLRAWPELGPGWLRMGEALAGQGQESLAFQCYINAVLDDPGNVGSHVALASIYLRNGLRREAIDHLLAAERSDPENPDLRREVRRLRSLNRAP
jgi:tetratricopeptide (TPR) repeat protein